MGKINLLSPHLVNRIAAGEVIERPASVVKELVENAIDAGAQRIDVTIEKGGKQLIAVTDDGCGISDEDLAKVFVPHATSKIACDDDLFNITTMGFRGEAMASIASISHAHIRTRPAEDAGGFEIEASGEHVGKVRPCAAAGGTTVTVRDLFFNTPARRKFLKADATEFGHISEAITRIALPKRRIAFTLTHNGRQSLDLPACDTVAQRGADLFGVELADQFVQIRAEDGDVRVSGLVATPSAGRTSAKWQYFFLNGRYIRDRQLGHALRESYRGLIEPGRYPPAIVFVDVPPDAVDVNVHPTKVEVRFRDARSIHSHVLAAIRQTLQYAELRPAARLPEGESIGDGEIPTDDRRRGLRDALAEFFKSQPAIEPKLDFTPSDSRGQSESGRRSTPPAANRAASPPLSAWRRPATTEAVPARPARAFPTPETWTAVEPTDGDAPAPPTAGTAGTALQVHNSYLIAADGEGLVIIDQHALHERILYNQLLRRVTAGPLEGQRLLLPVSFSVTAGQRAALAENGQLLDSLGIEVADFGPDSMAVQRFPSFLSKLEPAGFMADLLDRLAEDDPGVDSEHIVHSVLDMMACKAAVKAGDPLTQQEIDAILAQRAEAEKGTACPHGRPTQIRLTLKDLAKQFKRT